MQTVLLLAKFRKQYKQDVHRKGTFVNTSKWIIRQTAFFNVILKYFTKKYRFNNTVHFQPLILI